jgi:hypothetical protein
MKLTDWVPVIAIVQNGWTFAAFIVVLGVYLYFSRKGAPRG